MCASSKLTTLILTISTSTTRIYFNYFKFATLILMRRLLLAAVLLLIHVQCVHAAIQFTIADPTTTTNELTLTASISGLTSTSCDTSNKCYIQGTLRQINTSKYFG